MKHWMKLVCATMACMLMIVSMAAADELKPTEGITVPDISIGKVWEIPDNEGLALIRDMRCGWNLGNTFDAFGYRSWFKGPESQMETAWVGTMTTRKLMETLYEAGVRTIRMPVSWHDHVDENYTISEVWINRVREVADYALDLGMYVIVNVHHDNDIDHLYPDSEHYEQSAAYLTAIWSQMAEKFADCGDHLLLESMNEPRLVNTGYEWNWDANNAQCKDAADCINKLNQLFVDTVRATGGNNAERWLLVPAYDANPYYACSAAFQLPADPANRIIVAAHAYTPYDFALNLNSNRKSFDHTQSSSVRDIADFQEKLYQKFVANGIPVLIDEFGALDKGGNLQDRVNFAAWYIASASKRGMTCVWWDNHAFSGNGELFGLINRKNCTWTYPDIMIAMQLNCMKGRE